MQEKYLSAYTLLLSHAVNREKCGRVGNSLKCASERVTFDYNPYQNQRQISTRKYVIRGINVLPGNFLKTVSLAASLSLILPISIRAVKMMNNVTL